MSSQGACHIDRSIYDNSTVCRMPKKHRPKTEGASNPPKDEAEGREDAPELVDLEDGANVEDEVTIDEPEIAITNESQKVSSL